MTEYVVRLSGPVQVERDGEPLRGFESDKALALLAYLVLQRRAISRETLAGLFWGDLSQEREQGNLRRVLHNLNRLLPGCLEVDRRSVRFLCSGPCRVDVLAFEAAAAREGVADLEEAAGWYTGELLEGLSLSGCAEFELWLVAERERWMQRALQVLDALAEHHTRRGDYLRALTYVDRMLVLAPWRERAHRQKMLLLSRSGQCSAALRQYDACRRSLSEELGVEPLAETNALYERLRAAGRSAGRALQLPSPPSPLVGRQAELDQIARFLADPGCRLLTLTGPGGVGKTRLALEAAQRQRLAFLDGVCFVPLAALDGPQWLLPALAGALALSLEGRRDARTVVLNHLRDKELLLVWDNFEHLLGGAGELAAILAGSPQVKMLVTSREPLRLRWEQVFPLGGLSYPHGSDTLAGLPDGYEAVQLFLQQARRVDNGFALTAESNAALARICRLVEGLPLALELAAAWVGGLSLEQIAGGLAEGLDLLASTMRDAPLRQRSLHASFDVSWSLLDEAQREVFRRLSVFRGSFDAPAARQVAGAPAATLRGLVEKSLLRHLPSGRYEVHELLRQFAGEQLDRSVAASQAAHEAHAAYYAQLARAWASPARGVDQGIVLREIRDEIGNLRAAWDGCLARRDGPRLEMMLGAMTSYYTMLGFYQEGQQVFARAVQALGTPEVGTPEARVVGKLLARSAELHYRLGLYAEAEQALRRGLELAGAQEPYEAAYCLNNLSYVAYLQDRYEQAVDYAQQSLAICEPLGQESNVATACNHLGVAYHNMGQVEQARQCYARSITIFRQGAASRGLVLALNNLANLCVQAGQLAEAESLYREILAASKAIDYAYGRSLALNNLGCALYHQGRYDEAEVLARQGLDADREMGDPLGEAGSLDTLGLIARARGDLQGAAAYHEASLDLCRRIDSPWGTANALNALGEIARRRGEWGAARARWSEALSLALQVEAAPVALGALAGLATVLDAEGRSEDALALLLFVGQHPAAPEETRAEGERLVTVLRQRLSPETVARAERQGRALDMERAARCAGQ